MAVCLFSRMMLFILLIVLYNTVPSYGLIVLTEGCLATERTTDISLRCDVTGLLSEDELIRATWYYLDQSYGNLVEIFSADLTSEQSAFYFSSGWAGRGQVEPMTLASIRLPFQYVTRDFSGTYRCHVSSLMSRAYSDAKVDVFFGPGTSIVIAPGGRVEKQEGEELLLACTAQCNPSCSYRWYKAGRKLSDASVFNVTSLTGADAGLYACQARNDAGRSIKPVDVRVRFSATILELNITESEPDHNANNFRAIDRKTQEVAKTVVFTCNVKAWPEPTIAWSHGNGNSTTLQSAALISVTQLDLERRTSKYEISSATCRDNGIYTCKAWNGIGTESQKSIALNITCPPFVTNHKSSCRSDKEVTMAKALSEYVQVHLCFFGAPKPSVTIKHVDETNKELASFAGNVTCNWEIKHCETVFGFNITSPEQYGVYIATVSNKKGNFTKNYIINSQQPPLLPSTFIVSSVSSTFACFFWSISFNGGAKQTYDLEVHAANGKSKEDDSHPVHVITEEDESLIVRVKNVSGYTSCVKDLLPGTQYEAVLKSSNVFGTSQSPKNLTFTTSGVQSTSVPFWLKSDLDISANGQSHNQTGQPDIQDKSNSSETVESEFPPISTTRETVSISGWLEESDEYLDDKITFFDDEQDDDDDFLELDEIDEDNFFQLFDYYFTKNSSMDTSDPDVSKNNKPNRFSNYTYHFQRLLYNYARVQDKHFRLASSMDFTEGNTSPGVENIDLSFITPTLPTSVKPASELIKSLTVSAVAIGAMCILGIIITLSCFVLIKRRRRQKGIKRYQQKLKRANSRQTSSKQRRHAPPVPTSSASIPSIGGRIPSITCVSNENACFASPVSSRPRLATPDTNAGRMKARRSASDSTEASSSGTRNSSSPHRPDIPIITLENKRVSCPSYLELCQQAQEAANHPRLTPNPSDAFLSSTGKYLRPPNRSSSYTSVTQTQVKNLGTECTEECRSYLDLYEALASRSSSRSPSNIYDPLQFETSQNDSSSASGRSEGYLQPKQSLMMASVLEDSHPSLATKGENREPSSPADPHRESIQADEEGPECVQLRPKWKTTAARIIESIYDEPIDIERSPEVPRKMPSAQKAPYTVVCKGSKSTKRFSITHQTSLPPTAEVAPSATSSGNYETMIHQDAKFCCRKESYANMNGSEVSLPGLCTKRPFAKEKVYDHVYDTHITLQTLCPSKAKPAAHSSPSTEVHYEDVDEVIYDEIPVTDGNKSGRKSPGASSAPISPDEQLVESNKMPSTLESTDHNNSKSSNRTPDPETKKSGYTSYKPVTPMSSDEQIVMKKKKSMAPEADIHSSTRNTHETALSRLDGERNSTKIKEKTAAGILDNKLDLSGVGSETREELQRKMSPPDRSMPAFSTNMLPRKYDNGHLSKTPVNNDNFIRQDSFGSGSVIGAQKLRTSKSSLRTRAKDSHQQFSKDDKARAHSGYYDAYSDSTWKKRHAVTMELMQSSSQMKPNRESLSTGDGKSRELDRIGRGRSSKTVKFADKNGKKDEYAQPKSKETRKDSSQPKEPIYSEPPGYDEVVAHV